MKRIFLFLFFPLFLSNISFAQQKGKQLIDSLLLELPKMKNDSNKARAFNTIALNYMAVDPDQGFTYAGKGLELAEQINWKKGIANSHNTIGLMVGDTGNNTLAREHFEKSYALNSELDSKYSMISNLNNIGRSYQRESNYAVATDNYFKALLIAKETGSAEQIALVGTNITASFLTQRNYEKALEYAEMTLKNGELANAPQHTAKALLHLGIIKMEAKDTASAKQYMERALKVYEGMNNKPQAAAVLATMAQLELPDQKKAIAIALRAKIVFDEVGPASIGGIGNTNNLGQFYYDLALKSSQPEKDLFLKRSGEYLLAAAALCKQSNNAEYLANISLTLSDLEKEKGNYKASLEYFQTYTNINDSLFSQDKKNEIAGLEGKHNISLKDKEIAINQLMLSNQRRKQAGLITALSLFAIIIGLLYWQGRTRKKTNTTLMVLNNQLDEANKIKARFFGILSHDLRSPVSNLINFLHLQKNEQALLPPERYAAQQQKISQSAETLLETMEAMLLWSKEQMENFKPKMSTVPVSELFLYIQKNFAAAGEIAINFTYAPDLVVSTDENYLQIIMQNLTSNAIKALKNTPHATIEWKAVKDGDKTILSITDNGPGINDEQVQTLYEDGIGHNNKSGFGLHLVRDLAKAIQYKISVHSQPGVGTTFTLS